MNKRGRKILTSILTISIISLSSCVTTTPVCLTSSNTPLNGKNITENMGNVEGHSGFTFSILGLWMIGRPDIDGAVKDALQQKNADAVINIKCYENYYWFLAGGLTRIIIEGEAVKFEK